VPSLVYKVLLEVYSRVSLVAEHRLHPAELAEQIREGYALRDRPAMRADLRVPSLFAECLSSNPTISADVPKLASTVRARARTPRVGGSCTVVGTPP
jgi:hypothetical protein